jgi:hypothetical protein
MQPNRGTYSFQVGNGTARSVLKLRAAGNLLFLLLREKQHATLCFAYSLGAVRWLRRDCRRLAQLTTLHCTKVERPCRELVTYLQPNARDPGAAVANTRRSLTQRQPPPFAHFAS